MKNIKRCWVTEYHGLHSICFRTSFREKRKHVRLMSTEMPPTEPINNKKINIDEAKGKGISEDSYVLNPLGLADLIAIRDAIDKYIVAL